MTGLLDNLLHDIRIQLERHRNRPFLKAAMAGCALAATATGEVSFSERIRVDQILDTLEQLEVFDPHEGVELFNEYSQAILDSPRLGHEQAMLALAKVTDDPSSARVLLRVCLAVAEASGEKSLSQEIEMMMLCSTLGIGPKAVGLYEKGELPRGATS